MLSYRIYQEIKTKYRQPLDNIDAGLTPNWTEQVCQYFNREKERLKAGNLRDAFLLYPTDQFLCFPVRLDDNRTEFYLLLAIQNKEIASVFVKNSVTLECKLKGFFLYKVSENVLKNFQDLEKHAWAEKIQEGFFQLGLQVEHNYLFEKLREIRKMGTTNRSLIVSLQGKEYFVRINGKQYPPFNRRIESESLATLQQANIETAVLLNAPKFQICAAYPEEWRLDTIISRYPEKAIRALELVGRKIAQYHRLHSETTYSFAQAFQAEKENLASNFGSSIDKNLTYLIKACDKILECHEEYKPADYVFSHNDLLANSVFIKGIDTINPIVIVDWEYSAMQIWFTDLARLGSSASTTLTEALSRILANAYYREWNQTDRGVMPASKYYQIKCNRLFFDVIHLLWLRLNPENIRLPNIQEKIFQLMEDLKILTVPLESWHTEVKERLKFSEQGREETEYARQAYYSNRRNAHGTEFFSSGNRGQFENKIIMATSQEERKIVTKTAHDEYKINQQNARTSSISGAGVLHKISSAPTNRCR